MSCAKRGGGAVSLALLAGLPFPGCASLDPIPLVPSRVERVAPGVSATTIHGWQSGRLVRSGGVLYASAARSNPAAKHFWDHEGDLFRREADGGWIEAATLPFNPYTMAVGPDGTFWPRFIRQARWRGPGVGLLGAS